MQNCVFEEVYREKLPFWDKITPSERELFCLNSVAVNYAKGSNVHDGGSCSGLFFVRSGCLRVYIMSEEGKDITLYRLHSGDMCMLSASCVLQSITFDIFIDAEENSECFVINSTAFSDVYERNPR